jgi:rhamnose utilization protein RhaD (predicted bifunctional aldolase and dehydrogenase)|tara:strand:+ start:10515 stop:11552 length:1038 start_codon:yes stop_codon:yes gene_type:complete
MESLKTREQIQYMCVELGSDSLLVQGPGGNVSWKEGNTLWIKASGTWLSNAVTSDIFIPTDLTHIRNALLDGNFKVTPKVINDSLLKPSIETLLHGMMPQKVVIHLHAIDILSHLIVDDCEFFLEQLLPKDINYKFVKYCKPGADLAKSVSMAVSGDKEVDVIFLLNHGVVIAGESSQEVTNTLKKITSALKSKIKYKDNTIPVKKDSPISQELAEYGYSPVQNNLLHSLALEPDLISMVNNKWALFPDHVVFLGERAFIGDMNHLRKQLCQIDQALPPFIFLTGVGTFQHHSTTNAQFDQLNCFFDVAVRQENIDSIITLTSSEIQELLNWDAEIYRQSLSEKK